MRLLLWRGFTAELETKWARLLEATPDHSIFQTWEWNRAWWDAFGGRRSLRVVGVEEPSGVLIALAPWMVSYDLGDRLRRIEFVGTPNRATDYADVLVAPGRADALAALAGWLARKSGRHTEIDLRHLREDSPNLDGLVAALRGRDVALKLDEMTKALTRRLSDAESDRALLDKKSLRRHHEAFARAGRLEWRVASSVDAVLAEMPAFFDQHVRRRELAGTRSQFHDPAQRQFYLDLVRRLFPRGWLHFSTVRFDGAPIAYHFGFQYRGSYLWYKPSFEPSLARRSPGEVLLSFLIGDVLRRGGFTELDFTVGAEPFKRRFTNHEVRILRLRVPKRTSEPVLSPAVADDLSRLRRLGRGYVATALVSRAGEQAAAERFVARSLRERPQYTTRMRERMELALGDAAPPGLDLDRAALDYCRRTLEERWGQWRAMHRAGWQIETEVEGREHLEEALAAGRGAILWGMSFCGDLVYKIALHRAGVRLILLSAADHGAHYPPTRLGLGVVGPIVQRTENRYLTERVVIPPDQSLGYLRTIRARLESNATVWIAGERTAPRGNVDVRFLGRDLRLATGAASLAHSVGPGLLPVDVVREGSFRYRVRIDRPIAPAVDDKNGFVTAAVREFAARVEQRVLEHPADWMWETHVASRLLRSSS